MFRSGCQGSWSIQDDSQCAVLLVGGHTRQSFKSRVEHKLVQELGVSAEAGSRACSQQAFHLDLRCHSFSIGKHDINPVGLSDTESGSRAYRSRLSNVLTKAALIAV